MTDAKALRSDMRARIRKSHSRPLILVASRGLACRSELVAMIYIHLDSVSQRQTLCPRRSYKGNDERLILSQLQARCRLDNLAVSG